MRTISEIREALRTRAATASDVTQQYLARIEARDGELHAFLRVDRAAALRSARQVDAALLRGDDPGPLAGVPVAVKDNMATRGLQTTAGSKILGGFVPVYDAHVVARLRAAGAIIVGKTNLDEFAMGSSTENSAYGPTGNPHDPQRVPGGSSGGSAAAVGAGMACVSLGSDTGGSIRQPASLCGVSGMKPTYGRVSRFGLIAYASSLDQIGPFANNINDLAALLGVVAGHDPRDSTSLNQAVPDYTDGLEDGVKGLRIGVPSEYFGDGLDAEVEAAVRGAIAELAEAGAEIVDVSLPDTRQCLAAYYLIAPAEASSNLARYDGVRYGLREKGPKLLGTYKATRGAGFGHEVKRRIMIGTYALSAGYYDAYYGTAQRVRTLIRNGFARAFEQCDAIATPTSPVTAPKIGEVADPLAMYLMDVYTISANLAGIPALSTPCGQSKAKLPIGLQLLGPAGGESTLLRIARAHERAGDG